MKKLLFIIFAFVGLQQVSAQNEAIFNHYHINPILVNPAVAGYNDYNIIHLNTRTQWTSFGDSGGHPAAYAATFNGAIGKTFGLGAMIFNENIASLTRTRVQLDYSFRYQINEKVKFAFGFSTEWMQERIPNSVLNNPLYDTNDILLEDAANGRNFFDASLGAFATFNKATFVGVSFPSLISQRTDDVLGDNGLFQYYTLMAGHRFGVEGGDFELEPSIMIRQLRNVPSMIDFNIKAHLLEEKITTGITYRAGTGGAVALLLGTKLSNIRIYYSYDISFQRFQRYNNGSHELTASFEFGNNPDRAAKFRKKNSKK